MTRPHRGGGAVVACTSSPAAATFPAGTAAGRNVATIPQPVALIAKTKAGRSSAGDRSPAIIPSPPSVPASDSASARTGAPVPVAASAAGRAARTAPGRAR
ncbi:hypothetical protein [Actinomadura xylanilytica]|uniref:hypothetical protein n=1 Tax=Actinomadura xylanilytica TaxID=887459 RepID=UPI00255ABAD5|nr:hypothetical protein [Actinomadura xylanilytica]MDL4777564.1 hypothetical protein [Actinomadura xylanilytica]